MERGRGDRDSRPKTAAPITGGNYMAPGFGPPTVPTPSPPAFLQDGGQAFNKANREAAGQGVLGYPASAKQTLSFVLASSLPTWTGPVADVAQRRAVWQSPVIDLRADLSNQFGKKGNTTPMQRDVLLGYEYFMQVQTTWRYSGRQLNVYYVEFGHVNDPQQATQYIDRIDITSGWYSGSTVAEPLPSTFSTLTSVSTFSPIGIMRYYAVAMIFEQRDTYQAMPNESLTVASQMS